MKIFLSDSLNLKLAEGQLKDLGSLLRLITAGKVNTSLFRQLPNGVVLFKYKNIRLVGAQKKRGFYVLSVLVDKGFNKEFENLPRQLVQTKEIAIPQKRILVCYGKHRVKSGKKIAHKYSRNAHKYPTKRSIKRINPVWRKKLNQVFGDIAAKEIAKGILLGGLVGWGKVLSWFFVK